MRRRWFIQSLLFCAALSILPCAAQRAEAVPVAAPIEVVFGRSTVTLNGPWRFHTGDDRRWATSDFDDSSWETVNLAPERDSVDPGLGNSGYVPGWTALGHSGYWGYAWYRIRIRIDEKAAEPGEDVVRNLALACPASVDDAYQVFVNGKLLGGFGRFSDSGTQPVTYNGEPKIFSLSPGLVSRDEHVVIAFRVWMAPSTLTLAPDTGGLHQPPMLGDVGVLQAKFQMDWLDIVRSYASQATLAVVFFVLAILVSCLILFDRSDPVYLWMAAVFLLIAADAGTLCVAAWTERESLLTLNLLQDVVLRALVLGGWVMVWWVWFRLRRPAWAPKVLAALTLLYMLANAVAEEIFFTVIPHGVVQMFHFISLTVRVFLMLFLLLIAQRGIHRQGLEGWLALPALLLIGVAQFQNDLQFLKFPTVWFPYGVQLSIADLARLVLAVVLVALLFRRLLLSVQRQREMTLDVKQAREVQQVLIPDDAPAVPGLTIESDYRPAREVGGDFFQILPCAQDGSVLIVVGDVTGKGLQAGMLVALIVGAIRNQIETSFSPLAMLHTLNRLLCGRGSAYATCQAILIEADGQATLVNAGHLAPYLNGKELRIEGSLPLGLYGAAEFSTMPFHLARRDRLFLMSDGVAEAQNVRGQLFGFERIVSLIQSPITAAELATAAQAFGSEGSRDSDLGHAQSDDILVLCVVRQAVDAAA